MNNDFFLVDVDDRLNPERFAPGKSLAQLDLSRKPVFVGRQLFNKRYISQVIADKVGMATRVIVVSVGGGQPVIMFTAVEPTILLQQFDA